MKAILFYLTSLLTIVLLASEVNVTWLILAMMDMALIAWCMGNISTKELIKYSGYKLWYRMLS